MLAVTLAQFFAMGLLIWELYFVVKQTPSRIQAYLMLVIVCTVLILIGYEIELSASTLEVAYIGRAVATIGKPYAILFTTLFIMKYCGRTLPSAWGMVLVFYNAIFPILVFTNNLHHLFYLNIDFDSAATYSGLILEHGALYPLYMVTMGIYLVFDIAFIIVSFRKAQTRREFVQITYFCGIILSVTFGYFIYASGITDGYDTTMLGCAIGAMFLFLMFTRNELFDVIALAKDQAVDEAQSGILVVDRDNLVEYENAFVKNLLDEEIFTIEEIVRLENGDSVFEKDIYAYAVRKKPIRAYGEGVGYIVEIVDFTDSYNYTKKLEKEVAERVDSLRHVQRGVIAGFTNMVEARDGNTGDHIKNTEQYVRMICDGLMEIGWYDGVLSREYANYICDAAPMHDIGKIAVSDTILLKPGKLSSEEFEIMKTHTVSGRDIIESTMRGIEADEYVDIAKEIAMYHHEKWDGTGYPEHLVGEKIPLPARIMAVADVYDALVTKRVYKDAMSFEKAIDIIKEGQGTHFDPVIVEVFLFKIMKSMNKTMSDLQPDAER